MDISNPKGSADNDLRAPAGWKKKLVPKKSGTPKNDVFFVAPTGEEFKTKRPLERYLKVNAGGPSITDFDWSTGEITPTRRSARISEKVKESLVKTAESGLKKKPKRARKSHGDSEEAVDEEEEILDAHQGEDTVKAKTGEEEENEEGKDTEAKPEIMQQEKVDEPKTAETNEIVNKADEKAAAKQQTIPDEGALEEHSVVENEAKPKDLENKNENGFDGKSLVENYDPEKYSEPVKEVHELSHKVYGGEEVQKDSSSNHSEAKEPTRSTFNVVS